LSNKNQVILHLQTGGLSRIGDRFGLLQSKARECVRFTSGYCPFWSQQSSAGLCSYCHMLYGSWQLCLLQMLRKM